MGNEKYLLGGKSLTPKYVSSSSHHLVSEPQEGFCLINRKWSETSTSVRERKNANRKIFTSMSASTFFPSLGRMHGDTSIYQKVFQLYSLYQVRVPVKIFS